MFADTCLDDGLHSIVDKDATTEEKEWAKQQKTVGAMAHLTLQAMEGYSVLYKKLTDLVNTGIGQPSTANPEWTGEDDTLHDKFVYSEWQNHYYEYFQTIQRELHVDVAEPMANVARIAADPSPTLWTRGGKR